MGYTTSGIRLVGPHPLEPRILYNLGCNGVGILPSIAGAYRISRLIMGEKVPISIVDPSLQIKAQYLDISKRESGTKL